MEADPTGEWLRESINQNGDESENEIFVWRRAGVEEKSCEERSAEKKRTHGARISVDTARNRDAANIVINESWDDGSIGSNGCDEANNNHNEPIGVDSGRRHNSGVGREYSDT